MCAAIPMLRTRDNRSHSTGSRLATMSSCVNVDGSSFALAKLGTLSAQVLPCHSLYVAEIDNCTYTCAAADCHRRCWLLIHVSVFTPLVKGVRDAAAVESAHREGVREAVRAAVRRLLVASDCALMRD